MTRIMPHPAWSDPEQYAGTITEVAPFETGYEVHWIEDGHDGPWTCIVPLGDAIPKAGDRITLWGRGFGYFFRGQAINGVVQWYRNADDDDAYRRAELDAHDARRKVEWEAERPSLDAAYAALPEVFQQRLDGLRTRCMVEWWRCQGYEQFVCTEAVNIAQHCGDTDAIRTFHDLPWEQQATVVDDGHSGNTFGAACRLARHFLTDPQLVIQEHAAMCPLDGCRRCGCWAVTQSEATP